MDELLSEDVSWQPEDRIELRDWLMPEIEAVAERYRRHTGAGVRRIEVVVVDERGDTKQMNFILHHELAD